MDNDPKSFTEMDPKTTTEEENDIIEGPEERQEVVGVDQVIVLMREFHFKYDDEQYINPEDFFPETPSTSQGIGLEMPEAPEYTNKEKPKGVHYCLNSMPTDEQIAAMTEDELLDFLLDAEVYFPENMRRKLLPYAMENLKSMTGRILLKQIGQMMGQCEPDTQLAVLCGLGHCRCSKDCNRMHKTNQRRQPSENQPNLDDTGHSNGDRIQVPMPKTSAESSVVHSSDTGSTISTKHVNSAKIFIEALQNNTTPKPSNPNIPNINIASLSAQLVAKLSVPKADGSAGAESGEEDAEDEKWMDLVRDVAASFCDLLSKLSLGGPTDSTHSTDERVIRINKLVSQIDAFIAKDYSPNSDNGFKALVAEIQSFVAEDNPANINTDTGAKIITPAMVSRLQDLMSDTDDATTYAGGVPKREDSFNTNPTSGGQKLNDGDDNSSDDSDGTSPNTSGAAYNTGKELTLPHPRLPPDEANRMTAAIIARFIDQDCVKLSARLSSRFTAKYFGTTNIEIEALNISAVRNAAKLPAKFEFNIIPYPFDIHDFPNSEPKMSARKAVYLVKRHFMKNGDKNGVLARLLEKNSKPKPPKILGTLIGIKQNWRQPPKRKDVRLLVQGRVSHRMKKLAVTKVIYQVQDVSDYIFEELGACGKFQ